MVKAHTVQFEIITPDSSIVVKHSIKQCGTMERDLGSTPSVPAMNQSHSMIHSWDVAQP